MLNEEGVVLDLEDSTNPRGFIGLPLKVESEDGATADEMVATSRLTATRYLVRLSPGFYRGIAADDEIEYDPISKSAKVVTRGGNIAIQIFHEGISSGLVESFKKRVVAIGGRVDGELETLLVITFPIGIGFPAIESLMATLPESGIEWEYGNVYGEDGEPLGWWE
ncbi:DUF4265 domain-containing protein [Streptomyces hokutonensis]|uniref:DUF4265 domain-containing protein n=1 Tax=Streptomyces hokutonensis TaxID=1306990 RepID=UPI001319FEB1|nr:DUF4265 domain-containing protein [Streptomyces hokutonensis]